MAPRIVTVNAGDSPDLTAVTRYVNDREFAGASARPADDLLVFTESTYSAPFTYHGGPVGGVATPIQLIFWGTWWETSEGIARRDLYIKRTRQLLDSTYFSQLDQYLIARPPVWRGDAMVVREPAPPGRVESYTDAGRAVLDMVDDLIDDEIIPDPDDGRIGIIVMMPKGFEVDDANGAHSWDYDIDFPFDSDAFWAGWCRWYPPGDEETAMQTVAHEIVEMLTDPELDGWRTSVDGDLSFEIADVATTAANDAYLSAWVNDVNVQAYWSNRHMAPVIPMGPGYEARIVGEVREKEPRLFRQGSTFRPSPGELAACSPQLPECCIEDRDYVWQEWSLTEEIHLDTVTGRYVSPSVQWFLDGHALPAVGVREVTVDYEYFPDGSYEPATTRGPVKIAFNALGNSLVIWAPDGGRNFDLPVTCTVSELAITGNVASALESSPRIVVGFVGAVVELEQDWVDQKTACLKAMLRRYLDDYVVVESRPWRDPQVKWQPGLEAVTLPAYARVTDYEAAREVTKAARAAHAILEPELATAFVEGLVAGVPALSAALQKRRRSASS